ncbi:MAG: hypothetical protein V4610_14050 [Pseudomonadota bacterium]|jgi:hypothetical protein
MDRTPHIAGGGYGAFRAAALADAPSTSHQAAVGAILMSGDIPNIPQPTAFYDAMHIPARTATAIHYRRLDAGLLSDRDATMANWARTAYIPALECVDQFNDISTFIGQTMGSRHAAP